MGPSCPRFRKSITVNLFLSARYGGLVAQRLEQRTHNPLVPGSNPGGPTNIPKDLARFFVSGIFSIVGTFVGTLFPYPELIFPHSGLKYRPSHHAIKSLGLGRRLIYLFCWTLDVSRALVGCAVCCGNAHSVSGVAKTIRWMFLSFREGSCHEAYFFRPRPCSHVFVRLLLLRSVRSGRRSARRISRGIRAVSGLGDSVDSRSAALFSAYGGHQPEDFAGRSRPLAGSQCLPAGLGGSATQGPSY